MLATTGWTALRHQRHPAPLQASLSAWEDVADVHRVMDEEGRRVPVIAKVEKPPGKHGRCRRHWCGWGWIRGVRHGGTC
ncbi:hypothetical protein ACWDUG_32490, partial [Streptomyces cellulosae]